MKIRRLTQSFAATAAAITFATGVFADETIKHHQNIDRFGTAAHEKATSRVIKLDANSKSLNVKRGETVTIAKGGKSFK